MYSGNLHALADTNLYRSTNSRRGRGGSSLVLRPNYVSDFRDINTHYATRHKALMYRLECFVCIQASHPCASPGTSGTL